MSIVDAGYIDIKDIKHPPHCIMDASVRHEFGLSAHEYAFLLATLHERFEVDLIHDVAFLSETQLTSITDHWEAAAVHLLAQIVTAHLGVEKFWRAHRPLASDASSADTPTYADVEDNEDNDDNELP
jgi:hypothetical protein